MGSIFTRGSSLENASDSHTNTRMSSINLPKNVQILANDALHVVYADVFTFVKFNACHCDQNVGSFQMNDDRNKKRELKPNTARHIQYRNHVEQRIMLRAGYDQYYV